MPPTKSSRIRRIIYLSIFFLVVVLLLALNGKQWYLRSKQRSDVEALKSDIATLGRDEQSMRELLEELKSPLYIEREGRTRLGYKKEGETTVIFPAKDDITRDGDVAANEDRHRPPFIIDWFQYFFPRE